MVSFSKFLFLLLLSVLISISDRRRQTTLMLYQEQQEILIGRVKQLIQTGLDLRGSPFLFKYSDTICFSREGAQTTEKSGWSDGFHYEIGFDFTNQEGQKSLELPYPRSIGKRKYKFDNDGHLLEAYYYNEFGFFQKSTFLYDSNAQLIEVDLFDKKSVLFKKVSINYSKGFISGESYSTFYNYLKFDKNGNWTIRVSEEKNANFSISRVTDTILRKITYY